MARDNTIEVPLLDRAWLAKAAGIAGDQSVGGHEGPLRVQYVSEDNVADTLSHYQVFEAGILTSWVEGVVEEPDVCLCQPGWAQLAMFERSGLGTEVMLATAVRAGSSGEDLLAPPLDEVRLPWATDAPVFDTVGPFTVQQTLVDSPFGDVDMFVSLDKGQVVDIGLGAVEDPEVLVVRRYSAAVRERMGLMDVAESLEGGWLDGDLRYVTVFVGLYETDECIEARRALTSPCCEPLAALGDILSSPGWVELADELGNVGLSVP